MKRRRTQRRLAEDQVLLTDIRNIKCDHPAWGYRRIWAYLKYREGHRLGKNRVYRVMQENNLLVHKNKQLKATRGHGRPKPQSDYPNQFWGMDMTKIKLKDFGWIYLHVVLDWYSKEIVGYSLSVQSKTKDWLEALHQAINKRYPDGILNSDQQPNLITDNGCQPTSVSFMKECSYLGIKQIFTTYNNPKGNADTERVMRTIKEDIVWPYEWDNPFDFSLAFEKWVHDYNNDFPHQSLGYQTPTLFFENWVLSKNAGMHSTEVTGRERGDTSPCEALVLTDA